VQSDETQISDVRDDATQSVSKNITCTSVRICGRAAMISDFKFAISLRSSASRGAADDPAAICEEFFIKCRGTLSFDPTRGGIGHSRRRPLMSEF
jgi:hypothetical protein